MVKVEMRRDDTGVVSLAFESSDDAGRDVIDMVRAVVFADVDKQCGYINSNRLVVKAKMFEPGETSHVE